MSRRRKYAPRVILLYLITPSSCGSCDTRHVGVCVLRCCSAHAVGEVSRCLGHNLPHVNAAGCCERQLIPPYSEGDVEVTVHAVFACPSISYSLHLAAHAEVVSPPSWFASVGPAFRRASCRRCTFSPPRQALVMMTASGEGGFAGKIA